MTALLAQFATLMLPLVLAIVCHEVAHGWVARHLGDRTAHDAGRLTLNPLVHVDLIGTVLLPGMLALLKLPVFGWAKPVPVDPRQLRNPRVGMMLVAAAGPLTNLVLGLAGALLLGALARTITHPGAATLMAREALDGFIAVNVFLALFNMLPVPPFDGSHIVEGLLPRRATLAYKRLRPLGLPLMLGLLVVLPRIAPDADIVSNLVLPPASWVIERYQDITCFVAVL